jgi:tRNA (Thr-GGU) A37 N-methylase
MAFIYVIIHRTGTPRQPHLVPAARAVLRLAPGIPPTCLEGLQQFSHCWVLYVFHENTGAITAPCKSLKVRR